MKHIAGALALMSVLFLSACGKDDPKPAPPPVGPAGPPKAVRPATTANGEAAVLTVEHILIGVKGGRASSAKREQGEAQRVAFELLGRARSGEDFVKLRDEYTEDPGKGPYTMTNIGIDPADRSEYGRDGMAKAFGDVSFRLEVGQVGITDYDPATSPFGYHVIKRVK